MGMSAGGGNPNTVKSDINITPLIDVVLVLLIIFLVTLPIMMKMVTLEVPRKINENEAVDPSAGNPLVVKVKADLTITYNDGDKDSELLLPDLATKLRPALEKKVGQKVVFVDFEDRVPWAEVINVMDTIRSLSADLENHNDIKVALKTKDPNAPATP